MGSKVGAPRAATRVKVISLPTPREHRKRGPGVSAGDSAAGDSAGDSAGRLGAKVRSKVRSKVRWCDLATTITFDLGT